MTASTEQEHALANLRHLYKQMVNGAVKDSAQARRIAEMLLSPAIAKIEQAARRAPVVPQGWRLVPVEPTDEMLSACLSVVDLEEGDPEDHRYDDGRQTAASIHAAMLAAAPQPPACNPSMQPTADHFPAVGQMVAQRIYTYKQQPTDNVVAWRFGEACSSAKPGGDYIDRGLSLLQQLEKKGYGIAELKK